MGLSASFCLLRLTVACVREGLAPPKRENGHLRTMGVGVSLTYPSDSTGAAEMAEGRMKDLVTEIRLEGWPGFRLARPGPYQP